MVDVLKNESIIVKQDEKPRDDVPAGGFKIAPDYLKENADVAAEAFKDIPKRKNDSDVH